MFVAEKLFAGISLSIFVVTKGSQKKNNTLFNTKNKNCKFRD